MDREIHRRQDHRDEDHQHRDDRRDALHLHRRQNARADLRRQPGHRNRRALQDQRRAG